MIARISTRLACSEEELWQRILEPKSLQFVASPLLSFAPANEGDLDGEWQVGTPYPLQLYLLKFIPLGGHTIELLSIDERTHTLVSRERGRLARVWNHTISFQQAAPGFVDYTDEIEIHAGWLTPVIWSFAQIFYRHRQRRWKVLLRKRDSPGRSIPDHESSEDPSRR
ncbi:MAG TPA: hypothetical protein VKA74_17105 [Myxococcota bacterium]|nr:hypothetical protein [Myxococcota bacterium]